MDQGLGFDLGTLMNRRRVLGFFGVGAATVGLAACGASTGASPGPRSPAASPATASPSATAVADEEIPDETAGPYPGDGSNGPHVLEQSGIVRSDLRSSSGNAGATAQGVPMTLELTVADGGADQLGAVTGSASSGYAVTLTAGVDTTTTPTGGGTAGAPVGAPPAPPAG